MKPCTSCGRTDVQFHGMNLKCRLCCNAAKRKRHERVKAHEQARRATAQPSPPRRRVGRAPKPAPQPVKPKRAKRAEKWRAPVAPIYKRTVAAATVTPEERTIALRLAALRTLNVRITEARYAGLVDRVAIRQAAALRVALGIEESVRSRS